MFIFSIETIIGAILLTLIIIFKVYFAIKDSWKQSHCQHESISESMACDAICNNCSKNLGFIGEWRKNH